MSDTAAATITEFTRDDYARVEGLWREAGLGRSRSDGLAQLELMLARDPGLLLVARRGDAIVGSVLGGWDGRRGYVYHLAVDPACRRRGIAGLLMDELEDRLRVRGAVKCKLQVLTGNDTSLDFFTARGYQIESPCIPVGKVLVDDAVPGAWSV